MGERIVPTCDIFKTLQPKGLYPVYVKMWRPQPEGEDIVMVDEELAVSKRGLARVSRLVYAATQPPKTQKAKNDA